MLLVSYTDAHLLKTEGSLINQTLSGKTLEKHHQAGIPWIECIPL